MIPVLPAEAEEEETAPCLAEQAEEERHKGTRRRVSIRSILLGVIGILSACALLSVGCVLIIGRRFPTSADDDASGGVNNGGIFPTRDDTLAMATLSEVIYYFHRSKQPGHVICQNFNDRNFTELSSLLMGADAASSSFIQVGDNDEFDVSLGDAQCHWYYHDWSLGSQVMVVASQRASYVAVVFCGTDDVTTSLTDVNIFRTRFGITSNGTEILHNVDPAVLVHAGFDHAVFDNGLFDMIWQAVEPLLLAASSSHDDNRHSHFRHKQPPPYRIFTTGHSLGAADAILTAVGLLDRLEEAKLPHNVTVLNFGCPRTGNVAWRDFVHAQQPQTTERQRGLAVWRFVLGWDLIARLPEFYYHVGHTIQLSEHDETTTDDAAANTTTNMRAYFHHVGDPDLGYAGVPLGWSATPYAWLPGALSSHHIGRYRQFVLNATTTSSSDNTEQRQRWVHDFVKVDDHVDPNPVDDDFYDVPPEEMVYSVQ